jgi:hypothetical protein
MQWVEEIRQAANESNWNKYTDLMGGVFCKRTEQLIRPLYVQKRNNEKAQAANSNVQQTNQKNCSNPQSESRIEPLNIPESIQQTIKAVSSINTESHTVILAAVPEPITGNFSTNPETKVLISETNNARNPSPVIGIAETHDAINVYKEYKTNCYGDEVPQRYIATQLKGIVCLGVEIITRHHEWTLTHTNQPNAVNLESSQ